jgi:hypothetical protein
MRGVYEAASLSKSVAGRLSGIPALAGLEEERRCFGNVNPHEFGKTHYGWLLESVERAASDVLKAT